MLQLVEKAFPAITSRALRQQLIDRAAGNPFFLEELARDALDLNAVADPGQDVQPIRIPPTVQSVVAARIDRLPAEHKALLITASAFGNRLPLKALRRLFADRSETRFQACLDALGEAEMLRLFQGNPDIHFSHALVQEVAYSALPRVQRIDLHKKIVSTLKEIDPDNHSEHVETLVYHAARGEVWDELVSAARVAGGRALSRSAYVAAGRFFRQAIAACEHLPRSDDLLATEIDLRFELRTALFRPPPNRAWRIPRSRTARAPAV